MKNDKLKKLKNMCKYGFWGHHRQELYLPHSSEGHQAPPEWVEEGPGAGGVVLLGEVDQGRVGEYGHRHQHQQQPELLVSLLKRVDQRLKAGKMSNEFENSQYSHDADEAYDLTSFPDNLVILKRE